MLEWSTSVKGTRSYTPLCAPQGLHVHHRGFVDSWPCVRLNSGLLFYCDVWISWIMSRDYGCPKSHLKWTISQYKHQIIISDRVRTACRLLGCSTFLGLLLFPFLSICPVYLGNLGIPVFSFLTTLIWLLVLSYIGFLDAFVSKQRQKCFLGVLLNSQVCT